jgi:hypothetical protein
MQPLRVVIGGLYRDAVESVGFRPACPQSGRSTSLLVGSSRSKQELRLVFNHAMGIPVQACLPVSARRAYKQIGETTHP